VEVYVTTCILNAPALGYMPQQNRDARERIHNKTLAYGILVHADWSRYGKLMEKIDNAFLKGNYDYPKTPNEAYNLLVNYRQYNNTNKRPIPGGLDQVAFVTDGKRIKTGKEFPHIKCLACGEHGHYKSDSPKNTKEKIEETGQMIQATTLMTYANYVSNIPISPMCFFLWQWVHSWHHQELGINVHVVSKNEHAPEIEWQNRVIKERARAIVQTLPYDKLPRKIRLAMINYQEKIKYCPLENWSWERPY